jgi:membrane associated rhomboid family serine protease
MLIPIGDIAPRRRIPVVNYLLIAANIGAFFYLVLTRGEGYAQVVQVHGLTPDRWNPLQFLTSMFLHAGAIHLLGNMLFLWITGDNVEDRFGHLTYPLFYLSCGIAAGLTHFFTAAGAERLIPCIGASGAVSGIVGAYLVLFPRSRIKLLLWIVIPLWTFTIPSWVAILGWLGLQALMAWQQLHGASIQVAVWAHLGGFAFGFASALLLRLLSPRS